MNRTVILLALILSIGSGIFLYSRSQTPLQDNGMKLEEFNKKIKRNDKLVLVYFYADWCMVCPKLKPIIEQVSAENASIVDVLKLDVDKSTEVRDEFEIDALPVLVLYKDGKNVWTHVGLTDKKTLVGTLEAYKY